MSELYREEIVWRRINETEAVRYACFQNLRTGRYCVQAADFVRPALGDTDWQARNRLELLLEGQLEACEWHDSLVAAIKAFDEGFGNAFA